MLPRFATFGCLGRARHGKGTIAEIIRQWCAERSVPAQIISFADPLKDWLEQVVGRREPFRGNDVERNTPVPELPWTALQPRVIVAILKTNEKWVEHHPDASTLLLTPAQAVAEAMLYFGTDAPTGRQLLQGFGSDIVRDGFCHDTWARVASNRARKFDGCTILDDVRFPNEAMPRSAGGMFDYVLKVVRPGVPMSTHKSEMAVDEVPAEHISAVLMNDGDIELIRRRAHEWLDQMPAHNAGA